MCRIAFCFPEDPEEKTIRPGCFFLIKLLRILLFVKLFLLLLIFKDFVLTKKLQGINFNKFLCLIGTGITIKHSSIHAKKKAILWNSKSLSKATKSPFFILLFFKTFRQKFILFSRSSPL